MEREREGLKKNFICTIVKEVFFTGGEFCESFAKAEILVKFFKGVSDEISSLRELKGFLWNGIRFRNCSEDFSFVMELYRNFYDFSSTVFEIVRNCSR